MTISALSSLIPTYSVGGLSNSNSSSQTSSTTSVTQESAGISQLAGLMQQLHSLETSDPAKFKQVTADVATQLEAAGKAAADSGDSQGAEALNNLAAKFTTASETGKMPHMHRHGGHHGAPPVDSSTDQSSASSPNANLLAMFQQSSATDPFATLTDILGKELAS